MKIGKDIKIIVARLSDTLSLTKVKEGFDKKNVAERFRRLEKEADGMWLFLKLSDNIIGWCLVLWSEKKSQREHPFMEDLYIQPEHRNKGYGTHFIREIEVLAKEKGYKIIGLAVNPDDNQAALRLYERLGYRHDSGPKYLDGVYDGYEDWVLDLKKWI